jgi:hypothetical protein
VSNPPAPFVVELVHPVALEASPETATRAAAPTGRPVASLPQPPPLVALPLHAPRIGALRVPNRGPEPRIGSRRRALPPAAVVSRRPPLLSRSRASVAVRSRSNTPDLIQPPRFTCMHLQSLDLDPMDIDLVNRVKPGQTPPALELLQKTPTFSDIHRYTLPQRQNLYGLVLFLLF